MPFEYVRWTAFSYSLGYQVHQPGALGGPAPQ